MDRPHRLPDGAIANTVRPMGTPDNPFLVDENGHFGLTRSTAETPFLVDENGEFVRSLTGARVVKRSPLHGRPPVKRSPSARPFRMYGAPNGGPPSAIRQDIPRRRARREQSNDRPYLRALALAGHPLPPTFATPVPGDAAGSSSAAGSSTDAAPARRSTKKSLFRSTTNALRLRTHKTRHPGFRTPRETPFTVKDLYLTDARPPADSDPRPHHECSVCYNIKSHPVAYRCGHSHCYVCVREWLETSWACPFCGVEMTEEPMPGDDAKRAIAFDHPEWQDHSLAFQDDQGTLYVTSSSYTHFHAQTCLLAKHLWIPKPNDSADKTLSNDTLITIVKHCGRARARQLSLRSQRSAAPDGDPSDRRERANATAAKYRERNRKQIRAADRVRRARRYIKTHGLEAFEEKEDRGHMSKTQKLHEGESVPARPRPPLRKRFDPSEILTENQRRCRALRSCGLEDDNGADSDEDLPRGMCGCDRTECQLLHKNESKDRKEWKLFHIKYRQELERGF
ncbi:hypothetical protein C8R47DRAFT_1210388 [Mycena vitilis]|nr:hypothetical protein C8R47DRAFT_1210388 [Mycena vitilis]